jgi:branched-chain amino acid transport system permease protein
LSGGPNGIPSIPRPSFFGLPFKPPGDDPTFASFFGLEYCPQPPHHLPLLPDSRAGAAHQPASSQECAGYRSAAPGKRCAKTRSPARRWASTRATSSSRPLPSGPCSAVSPASFFAARQGFISPESFTFNESAIILAIVVLGGMGSQLGVVLASLVLVLLPELGRDFAEYRMLLFGAAMILIMVWKPGGILSHREPTLRYLATTGGKPMSAAPQLLLSVERLTHALRRPAGHRRPVARRRRPPDHRRHWTERRRQDHLLQLPDRFLQADAKAASASTTRNAA